MARKISIPHHVEIDVQRPDGTVETVCPEHPQYPGVPLRLLTEREFAAIRDATAKAGRGTCLRYRVVEVEVDAAEPTAADLAEEDYLRRTRAVYRASAGGEPCDTGYYVDRSPAHKSDF